MSQSKPAPWVKPGNPGKRFSFLLPLPANPALALLIQRQESSIDLSVPTIASLISVGFRSIRESDGPCSITPKRRSGCIPPKPNSSSGSSISWASTRKGSPRLLLSNPQAHHRLGSQVLPASPRTSSKHCPLFRDQLAVRP